MKQEIYRIVDCFLTEAKDQNGNDRSLERLNADRHLAVEALQKLLDNQKKAILDKIEQKKVRPEMFPLSEKNITKNRTLEDIKNIINNLK